MIEDITFLEFFFLSLGMAECEAKNDEPLKVFAAVFNEFATTEFDIFFFCSIEPPPLNITCIIDLISIIRLHNCGFNKSIFRVVLKNFEIIRKGFIYLDYFLV